MSVAFDHREQGTPEARWQTAAPWSGAGVLEVEADHVIVVAAHPDDETLGAGGLIWTAAHAGLDVAVLIATDGEASDPDATDPAALARRRRRELVTAMAEIAPRARLRFLGIPDGALDRNREVLRTALSAELGDDPWRVLLAAPWRGDGHRDHRVAGEEAAAFAGPGVRVVGYPVWLWHWGDPDDVDASSWLRLPLPEAAVAGKARALSRYRSQYQGSPPLLHAGMLAHFRRDTEVFVEEPADLRPSTPIAGFEQKFRDADDPWGFRTRWYERRKRALLLASLPRERFGAVLELGCANGELTAALAERGDHVVAVDGAAEALRRAGERVGGDPRVQLHRCTLPGQWPDGRFDLVVVSEIAYYWSAHALATAIARIGESLTDDGVLVLCHWRHPTADAALTADLVHAAFQAAPGWERSVRHIEDDFLLDVHVRDRAHATAGTEAAG